jgi:hypothetical protein
MVLRRINCQIAIALVAACLVGLPASTFAGVTHASCERTMSDFQKTLGELRENQSHSLASFQTHPEDRYRHKAFTMRMKDHRVS